MRQRHHSLFSLIVFLMLVTSSWANEPMRVVFLGDSLTAGYSLDANQAYPALIQEKIDERNWPFRVVNSGISGDTTAGGLRRLDWLMRQPVSVLVIALGANDGLRGFNPDVTYQNLAEIVDRAHERYPDVVILLAGMKMPANMGESYALRFQQIYESLAATANLAFMPFLLEDIAGIPELNLPDGIHPNATGQKRLADNVWKHLEPLLQELLDRTRTVP
ncbi:MAG TPA: arylesterase [Kiritimatiellia bacterium]|nr:arylesterase [Kiritimatiellia bacterium]